MAHASSEWIKWEGGECPVSREADVDVRFADGVEVGGISAGFWSGGNNADDPDYWRLGSRETIVAYRVVSA